MKALASPGPVASEFVRSPAVYRALIGPMWSGKKTTLVLDMIGRVFGGRRQRRWRVLLAAASLDYAESHVIPAIQHVIGEVGRWDERPQLRVVIPLIEDGRAFAELELILLGLDQADHRRKLVNLERTAVGLVDARALSESVFDDAAESIGTYPVDSEVRGWVSIVSRPPNAGHWSVVRDEIVRFFQPGGRSPQAENLPALAARNFSYARQAERLPANRVASDIDGEITGAAAATAAEAAREAARGSLTQFIRVAMPDIEPARHHRHIITKLEAVARRKIKRLMLFLPPGSAKSTYASVLFPPWWMGNNPSLPVIAASHSKELAERFGRRVRNIVGSPGFRDVFGFGLSGDSGAAGRWETARGGEYFAVGVDPSVTGRRAALGIIDDPVKGRAEADSATVRQHIWEWYKSDFWTRLIPEAALIYIGTRWHDDDLAGRLLEEAKAGGEQWEVVSLPAEAEENDALGRELGERLWPEWFTEDQLRIAKRDARNWSALYQQRPMPESGDYFKAEWFGWYDTPPPREQLRTYGASDYATRAQAGDWTVHMVVGLDPLSDLYILDLWREKSASDVWVEALLDLMAKWKTITWAEEAGQIRNSVGPFITKRQFERKIFGVRRQFTSSSDKPTRAQAIRGRMAMGKVLFPRNAPWVTELMQEFLRFPAGTYDDQVDAASLIGRMLDEMMPGTKPAVVSQPFADPANLDPRLHISLDRVGSRPDAPSLWSTAPGGANDPYRRGSTRI